MSGPGQALRGGVHPSRLVLVGLFLLALWTPRLEMSRHWMPQIDIAEKRMLAEKPRLYSLRALPAFIRGYEPFFDDHFGMRNLLVRLDSAIRLKILHTSPVTKLITGKEGWIFYDSEKVRDGVTMSDFKGLAAYSSEQLPNIRRNLQARVRACRERGAECLIVIVPNKETLFPEYMPASVRKLGPRTRLDQVVEALGPGSGVPLLDLRPALLRAKENSPYPLYNRGGTHWTQYGAYIAYREILLAMRLQWAGSGGFPGGGDALEPFDLEDFDIQVQPRSAEDHWLGLNEHTVIHFSLKDEARRPSRAPEDGALVVIHDSFWNDLDPLVAPHFPRMAVQHVDLVRDQSLAFIEREKPRWVLYEVAERFADDFWNGASP